LESRIIAVADAFDAMVGGVTPGEKRGYREPMDIDSALNELDRCAGTQFDVDVVRAFREVIESEANS
jgi:HD-GYP domain-containing protein (c-di-GMP phosphodiesterase class II)